MEIKEKKDKLKEIYDRFEQDVSEFRKIAVCKIGCSFCCTFMGNVDITTMEGIIIRERVNSLSKSLKDQIRSKLKENKEEKEKGEKPQCPFLDEKGTCIIYDVRPFSCRQLYSVKECDGNGPVVHRQAVEKAKKTIREIQQLDDTGYSGHHSFILHLLDSPEFRNTYLSGGFDPARIMKFGKAHGIIINRFAK